MYSFDSFKVSHQHKYTYPIHTPLSLHLCLAYNPTATTVYGFLVGVVKYLSLVWIHGKGGEEEWGEGTGGERGE